MPGKGISIEGILAMFEQLTGRKPTPEEIEKARRVLARDKAQ